MTRDIVAVRDLFRIFVGDPLMFVVLCACFTACGAWHNTYNNGVMIDQHAHDVPSIDDVTSAVEIFADEAARDGYAFDTLATLIIEWHAPGEVFYMLPGPAPFAENETIDGSNVRVTSFAGLAHELAHVLFFRTTGDGDSNHAEAPGPWTDKTDAMIERVIERYNAEGFTP